VVYTSDQGFFLGEHGWYDKRFIYEESAGMPLVMRYPAEIPAGISSDALVLNLDFPSTFLEFAGAKIPGDMQGRSLIPLLKGETREDWRQAIYYHYYEYPHGWHNVKRHYGVRTDRYKLIHFYNDIDEWELFDLKKDPMEMNNVYDHPDYVEIVKELKAQLKELQVKYKDDSAM
jgi:arylsulfatase A-like enzyme